MTNCGKCRDPFGKQSATQAVRIGMAHHNLDFDRMQVLAAIGLGHVLSGRTQSSATISEEYIFAADYSPGVSSKDLARPYAEEAGMVIKFRDKLDDVSSAILTIPFPGEEMPSVSAGACQIDARQDHLTMSLFKPLEAGNRPPRAGFCCKSVDQAGGKFYVGSGNFELFGGKFISMTCRRNCFIITASGGRLANFDNLTSNVREEGMVGVVVNKHRVG